MAGPARTGHTKRPGLQSTRKTEEGKVRTCPVFSATARQLREGSPVISWMLLGNYDNAGQQWRPAQPKGALPTVPRDGIYACNTGFAMSAPITTPAVASIRWWRQDGRRIYPDARTILITADGGGSNGWRLRLWKFELQKFAETGLPASVCHFPPGTSKWNKIEHRLFSFISSNWRGNLYGTTKRLFNHCEDRRPLKVTCWIAGNIPLAARSPTKK